MSLVLEQTAGQKQHAHVMIDLLAPDKLTAVVSLLEVMLDPVARTLANAPIDDEPLSAGKALSLDEASEWLKYNKAIPHDQVLAELGITQEEIDNYTEPA